MSPAQSRESRENVAREFSNVAALIVTSAPRPKAPPPEEYPTVFIENPQSGTVIADTQRFTFDATTGSRFVNVIDFFDGPLFLGSAERDQSGVFAIETRLPSPGAHQLRAVTDEVLGARAEDTVDVLVVHNEPPSVSISSPAAGATFSVPATVLISATASDAQQATLPGSGAVARVDFYANGVFQGSKQAEPYKLTLNNLNPATYQLQVRAIDTQGAATDSVPVTITVVAPPNQTPAVLLMEANGTELKMPTYLNASTIHGREFSQDVPLELAATITDPDGLTPQHEVKFVSSNESLPEREFPAAREGQSNRWKVAIPTSELQVIQSTYPGGLRTIHAVVRDPQGAESISASATIAIYNPTTQMQRPCVRQFQPNSTCQGAGPAEPIPLVLGTRIQAEAYDEGGHGIAYFERDRYLLDATKLGYRGDHVDVAGCPEQKFSDGCIVAHMRDGERLEYTVRVPLGSTTSSMSFQARVRLDNDPAGDPTQSVQVGRLRLIGPQSSEMTPLTLAPGTLGNWVIQPLGTSLSIVAGQTYILQFEVSRPISLDYLRAGPASSIQPAIQSATQDQPINAAIIVQMAQIPYTGTCSFQSADYDLTLQLKGDGVLLGSPQVVNTGASPSFTVSIPQAGPHYLTAELRCSTKTSKKGPGRLIRTWSSGEPYRVRVSGFVPNEITIDSPFPGQSFAPGTAVQVHVNPGFLESGQRVRLRMDGNQAGSDLSAPPFRFALPATLAAASYQLVAEVIAPAPSEIVIRTSEAVSFSIGSTAPPGGGTGIAPEPTPDFALPPLVLDPSSDLVGVTQGSFRVNEQGQMTYNIALAMAPGAAGITPSISLSYSSGGGDGYLGVGWALDGLQSISRCRKSEEAGDARRSYPVNDMGANNRWYGHHAVRFPSATEERDEYCLNGQRLLKVNGIAHGSDGARYRTEIDSFVDVVIVPDGLPNHAGAQAFQVTAKDGAVSTFGGGSGRTITDTVPTNARIPVNSGGMAYAGASNKSATMNWAISRTEDRLGNHVDYFYENGEGPLSGEQYIREIHYTGNLATNHAPQSRLVFEYVESGTTTSSGRKFTGFMAGMKSQRTKILTRILAYNGNDLYRTYHLGYDRSGYTERARLTSLQECADSTVLPNPMHCLPRTQFDWLNAAIGVESASTTTNADTFAFGASEGNLSGVKFGDINGDGRQDLVWVNENLEDHICWAIANPTGLSYTVSANCGTAAAPLKTFRKAVPGAASVHASPSLVFHLFDFNNDGREDLLVALEHAANWTVFLGDIGGFQLGNPISMGIATGQVGELQLGDFNGDGMPDALHSTRIGLPPGGGPPVVECGFGGFPPCREDSVTDPTEEPSVPAVVGTFEPFSGGSLYPRVTFLIRNGTPGAPPCGEGLVYCFTNATNTPETPQTPAFVSGAGVEFPECQNETERGLPVPFEGGADIVDFNGDGLNDIRVKRRDSDCGLAGDSWDIYLNYGLKWAAGTTPRVVFQPGSRFFIRAQCPPGDSGNCASYVDTPSFINDPDYRNADYRFQYGDFNGDGLPDVLYKSRLADETRRWFVRLNEGQVAGQGAVYGPLAFGSPIAIGDIPDSAEKSVQLADYDGDGQTDLIYGVDVGGVRQLKLRRWSGGASPGFGTAFDIANAISQANDSDFRSIFVDLDGDARPEQFVANFAFQKPERASMIIRRSRAAGRYAGVDMIAGVRNAFGAVTEVSYAPLTSAATYQLGSDTAATQFGRGSYVGDLHYASYVVREARASAPTSSDINALSRIAYRYSGARMQAGGRGFLGFEIVQSYDHQTGIESESRYGQSFPFIGMPMSTTARKNGAGWISGSQTRCLANPDSAGCFVYVPSALRVWPAGGMELHASDDGYDFTVSAFTTQNQSGYPATIPLDGIAPPLPAPPASPPAGSGTVAGLPPPLYVHRYESISQDFEWVDGSAIGFEVAHFSSYDGYGNLLETASDRRLSSTLGTIDRTVTTTNSYGTDELDSVGKRFGRLRRVSVITSRPDLPVVTRTSAFEYHVGSGQLRAEVVEPAGSSETMLVKAYGYDVFGNKIKEALCSGLVTDPDQTVGQACLATEPANVEFNSRVGTSTTLTPAVRRWSSVQMENDRRYVSFEEGAFSSGVKRTMEVLQRDGRLGLPTLVRDTSGNESRMAYGRFGRTLFESSKSGGRKQTEYRFCTAASPSTGGWWVDQQTIPLAVPCPVGASFRIAVQSNGSPDHWSYFDRVGREVQSVVRGYRTTEFIATATRYDSLGRVVGKSLPSIQTSSTAPPQERYVVSEYDQIGRVTLVTTPDGAVTRTVYGALQMTVTPPLNGDSGNNPRIERRNVLGEVVSVIDSQPGDPLRVCYDYDAVGNMKAIRKGGTSCASGASASVTTSMTYDVLGRKLTTTDPEKGLWNYSYNAAGEIWKQTSQRSCTLSAYDGRGRVSNRVDRASTACTGSIEHETTLVFDPAGNPGAPLSETVTSAALGIGTTPGTQVKTFFYDNFGRPQKERTLIDSRTFEARKTYDQFGRPFQDLFSTSQIQEGGVTLETGVLHEYTDSYQSGQPLDDPALNDGYARRMRDATGNLTGSVHYETFNIDAFGNVVSERRGDSNTLQTWRQYDVETGRIKSIKTGGATAQASGVAQHWTYVWDKAGNLQSRTEARPNQPAVFESFDYDGVNRLTTGRSTGTSIQYSTNGNISNHSGLIYAYSGTGGCSGVSGAASAGPHAVTLISGSGVTPSSYCYDSNGNQLRFQKGAEVRNIAYTSVDQAETISATMAGGASTTRFAYGAGRERIRRRDWSSATATPSDVPQSTTYYAAGAEIIVKSDGACATGGVTGSMVVRREFLGVILLVKREAPGGVCGTRTEWNYRLTDHLGSTDAIFVRDTANAIVPAAGASVAQQRFDPFGARRVVGSSMLPPPLLLPGDAAQFDTSITRRGYTGHEQVDTSGLIHLGGRIYDPVLARFVQADPLLPDVFDAQSLNRYSYCVNNPLAKIDPDGYRDKWVQWAMTGLSVYVALASGGTFAGYGIAAATSTSQAAFILFSGGVASGLIATGSMKAALVSGVTNLATFGAGNLAGPGAIGQAVARGAAAGVVSELSGGKFGHGFISAGIGSYLNGQIDLGSKFADGFAAAIVGGTISEATGGKFANGAVTAAFSYAFSSAASRGLATGSGDGPVSGANDFDVTLSRSYGSPDAAAIGFGGDYGPGGIRDRIEYNTAIVETFAADGYGPPAYSYTSPLAGDVGAKTVPLRAYLRAVAGAHGARNVVAIAHNHFDNNLKFTGIGLDTSVAQVMPLYVYNQRGETRVLNSAIIQREISGVRGANALQSYINANNGMNGRCIHGCR